MILLARVNTKKKRWN